MSHEKPVAPFSDLHVENGRVRATLLHDPSVEGLEMAIYMDGSGSMEPEYQYRKSSWNLLLEWLFGAPDSANGSDGLLRNQVEPQVRWMLEYLATKDRNGLLRVAYWACGESGNKIEVVGDLQGVNVENYQFPGPRQMGGQTHLKPAMQDFVKYLTEQIPHGARRGCAVFVTDGALHDAQDVIAYSRKLAREIASGRLPRLNFILVGVGDSVDEKQMEEIAHEEYRGVGHLWCHRIAEEIDQVAELVAVLVDETMTVAAGGTIYDDRGEIVKVYEARLPAVLEFNIPVDSQYFALEVNGRRFVQPIPEDDDDH
ncbi:MAG TPA: vWA domain-containing protein [Blastocatellia bacterium]|nr:vWA domain-containing protein [Blastocatellia bacterium]